MRKYLTFLTFTFFSILNVSVAQYSCDVSHQQCEKNREVSNSLISSNGDIIYLKIQFSHTQSLITNEGEATLLDIYQRGIDSLNWSLEKSGSDVRFEMYQIPLIVGTPTGNTNETWEKIGNNVFPYDTINNSKKCNNVHLNIHFVTDNYSGNGGWATISGSNGTPINWAHAVLKYQNNEQLFFWLLRHEVMHILGAGHQTGDPNWIGAFPKSHAHFSIPGSFGTIMYDQYLGPQFMAPIYSSADSLWNGYATGDPQHDNTSTSNDIAPFIASYFDFNYSIEANGNDVNNIIICEGETVTLSLTTDEGDEFMWEGEYLNGTGQDVSFHTNSPGSYIIIGSTRNSSEGSCVWKSDTLNIEVLPNENNSESISICDGENYELPNGNIVNSTGTYESVLPGEANNGCTLVVTTNLNVLPNESLDTIFTISTGETVTLPNGTVLDDTDNGEVGSYIVIDGASNGCDLTVNWTVQVITAVIDVGKDKRISVYPNPFNEKIFFNIDPSLEIEKVVLFTSTGQKIYEGPFTPTMQVNGAAGMYILQLMSKDNVFIQTLIKQ